MGVEPAQYVSRHQSIQTPFKRNGNEYFQPQLQEPGHLHPPCRVLSFNPSSRDKTVFQLTVLILSIFTIILRKPHSVHVHTPR